MDNETPLTEDMQLGRDLRQQIVEQTVQVDDLQKERIAAEKLREKLATDLRISESEASHLRSAVASFEQQVQALSNSLRAQADTVARLDRERVDAEKIRDKLTADLRISQSEASQLRSASASLERQVEILSSSLKTHTDAFARIQERDLDTISTLKADLSKLRADHSSHVDHTSAELARLRTRETELEAAVNSENAQHDRDRKHMQWLRALHIAMGDRPIWWFLLSTQSRRAREYERLRRVGLFDDRSYLARYSDVAAEGVDPLDHYIAHGMFEGRERI